MAFSQAEHPMLWEVTHHPVMWVVIVLGIGLLYASLILGGVADVPAGLDDANFAA